MNPITHYSILFSRLGSEKSSGQGRDGWFIFLLMNPNNRTAAGGDIFSNYSYLDERTENVTYHIPGYFDDFMTYLKNHDVCDIIVDGGRRLYFDRNGFQSTVRWLEYGSDGRYRYSEHLDLVIVRYRHEKAVHCVEEGFCLPDLVSYNLDRLYRDGVNTVGFIRCCKDAVRYAFTESELRSALDHYIESEMPAMTYTRQYGRTESDGRCIVVAGSSRVQTECDTVVSTLTKLSQRTGVPYTFKSLSFEDIRQDGGAADVFRGAYKVIFVLDGGADDMTEREFSDSIPHIMGLEKIHVYGRKRHSFFCYADTPGQLADMLRRGVLPLVNHYTEFRDADELRGQIAYDFMNL